MPCAFETTAPQPGDAEVVSQVPYTELSPADSLCLLPGPLEGYDSLDAATCQCHAATNTGVARAVDLERRWAGVLIECEECAVQESLCLTRSLIALQGADLRNKAAASALTSFYLLAGVEAKDVYLARGIRELDNTLRRIDRLRARGFEIPSAVEREELATRRDELEDQRLQLIAARVQLNGQLKRALGCPIDQRRFFWPEVTWTPDLESVDVQAEVAEGLALRTDLRSLRLVQCKLSDATLPVTRQVLQVADPTLGTVVPAKGWLHKLRCGDCYDREISIRCRQLAILEADTIELATGKIKSAACKVAAGQDRVRLGRQAVEHRRRELASLEKRRDVEDLSIFEISVARGRLFTAESNLVNLLVELKLAEVALREVQHVLAMECGHAACIPCEHRCTGACVPNCKPPARECALKRCLP